MDFLLECIGFPPDHDAELLSRRLRADGEPVAWRGPSGEHLRLALGGGLEVRLDREDGQDWDTLWPWYSASHRLRVAIDDVSRPPDSPFDALVVGRANPPLPTASLELDLVPEDWPVVAYVADARRLPRRLPSGRVLALSLAGYALDVTYVGPNDGVRAEWILERPNGAMLLPLGEEGDPGGCMELSARVRSVRRIRNPITGVEIDVIEADAPGRPLELFVSRWQLEAEGFAPPRPGMRIEGVFLLSGRVAGGLPRARVRESTFG